MEDILLLVDEKDNFLGYMGKEEAHVKGMKHRAFSIFVFNKKGELLIQRRALHKYHTPGLWANTCCSHPRYGETTLQAVHRRLPEEMGFDTKLDHVFEMSYQVSFDNGLTENEYDHVFFGRYEEDPVINEEEVADFKWMSLEALKEDMEDAPEKYTFWFQKILKEFDFKKLL
ncbi:MAG TPA: isopentenyl-diphosphate delta-isomerase [Clostridiaceae bacterium]|nr:isopentenyl-diphosphate delta-isomerase [Clostridiaceae bacterium]